VGLGLSLVQAVAKLHGSALSLSDRDPGLRVSLILLLDAADTQALATQPQQSAAGNVIAAANGAVMSS
jgi:hypothetical protein